MCVRERKREQVDIKLDLGALHKKDYVCKQGSN